MPRTIMYGYFTPLVRRINAVTDLFRRSSRELPLIEEETLMGIVNLSKNPINNAGKLNRLIGAAATKLELLNTNAPELRSESAQKEFKLMKTRLEMLSQGNLPD